MRYWIVIGSRRGPESWVAYTKDQQLAERIVEELVVVRHRDLARVEAGVQLKEVKAA